MQRKQTIHRLISFPRLVFLLLFRIWFSILYRHNYAQQNRKFTISERPTSKQATDDVDRNSRGEADFFPFPSTLVRGHAKEIPVREMTSLQLLQGDGWALRANEVHCSKDRLCCCKRKREMNRIDICNLQAPSHSPSS